MRITNAGAPLHYRAYLLRYWAEGGQARGDPDWRFSLEDPHSGERRGFAGLEGLVTWLQAEMDREQAVWRHAPEREGGVDSP